MLDDKGNILTTKMAIENRALEVYAARIKSNTIQPHLKDSETLTNKQCESRLETTKIKKSLPWTMEDLKAALIDLRKDKARDALDQANEL